jgi:hypothetical protein
MADLTASEVAAWWGASVATIVFAWDVYKWRRSSAKLKVSPQPNMTTFGPVDPRVAGRTFVALEVVNVGARATTITHLVGFHYNSIWKRMRRKASTNFVVVNNAFDRQLPCELQPGARWMGAFEQNEDLQRMGGTGYLYCGVIHATAKRPVLSRVRITRHAP